MQIRRCWIRALKINKMKKNIMKSHAITMENKGMGSPTFSRNKNRILMDMLPCRRHIRVEGSAFVAWKGNRGCDFSLTYCVPLCCGISHPSYCTVVRCQDYQPTDSETVF